MRKLKGAFAQPKGVSSQEHLARVKPLMDLDREWDDLRRKTHFYLVIAFGLAILATFGLLGDVFGKANESFEGTLEVLLAMFAIGLVTSSLSFCVYLVSAWFTMRNRKRVLCGEDYFIGRWESILSMISGLLGGLSALWFTITIAFALLRLIATSR